MDGTADARTVGIDSDQSVLSITEMRTGPRSERKSTRPSAMSLPERTPAPFRRRAERPSECPLPDGFLGGTDARPVRHHGAPVKGVSNRPSSRQPRARVRGCGGAEQRRELPQRDQRQRTGRGEGPLSCPTGSSDMIIGGAICRQLTHGNSSEAVSQAIIRRKPGVQPTWSSAWSPSRRPLTALTERSRSAPTGAADSRRGVEFLS